MNRPIKLTYIIALNKNKTYAEAKSDLADWIYGLRNDPENNLKNKIKYFGSYEYYSIKNGVHFSELAGDYRWLAFDDDRKKYKKNKKIYYRRGYKKFDWDITTKKSIKQSIKEIKEFDLIFNAIELT